MGLLENFELGQGDVGFEDTQMPEQGVGEIERGAWENLFVSMERSFYNIVDLAGTSVRKLSTFSFEEDDPRKETGIGWIGKHAGKVAADFRERADDPSLARETDPETMDKFAELLGTTVPYTVAALAGAAVSGGAGLGAGIGAAVTSFSIMREDAYRSAIETGVTHDEANMEGNIVGGVNALIEMAQIGGILRQSKTGGAILKSITLSARNKAWGEALKAGGKLSMGMVRNAAEEAMEEALQGTTSELVPKLLRGKEIEGGAKGFFQRRGKEAAAGALIGGVFSGLGQLGTTAMDAGKAYIPMRQEIESFKEDVTQTEDPTEESFIPEGGEDLQQVSELTEDSVDQEFSEEVQEGETASQAQVADAIVEGAEIEPTVQEIEADTRSSLESAIDKVRTAVKRRALGKVRRTTEQERSVERAKRTQKSAEAREAAIAEGATLDEARIAGAAELKGKLPEAVFNEITEEEMTGEDWDVLQKEVWDSEELQEYEKHNADKALNELRTGIVPTPSNLKILGKIVGKDVARGMNMDLRTKGQKIWDGFKNVLNLPSTMLTTFDVSLIGRQGLYLAARHPKQWIKGWKDSYKAFLDFAGGEEGFTSMAIKETETRAGAAFADRMGLVTTTLDGGFADLDEHFMSNIAKKIPVFGILVRASERAAVVGMNSLRTKVFDSTVKAWEGTGKTTQDYKELANIVNITTGIGKVDNKKVQAVLPFLTAAFFAPKYVKSRFDIIGELGIAATETLRSGKSISPARKLLVQQTAAFVSAGMMAMFLASMLPGVSVEKDPRSSDFGKMKVGRTRVDVWAGFQQIARTSAQLVTGRGKSISSGELYTKDRLDIIGKFVQSKLSPITGLAVDLLSGEDFLGQPLPTFEEEGEMMEYILSKLTPLVLQDMRESVQTEGWMGGLASGAAAFNGIGVQTFERTTQDNLTDLRDKYSLDTYQTSWDQLGPISQKLLRANNPDLIEQEKIAKYERRNATFDASRQREAGVAVEEQLPDSVMDELDAVSVSVGGLSRTIVRNWRLNGDLYKRYQDDLATRLNDVLPTLIGSDTYQEWTPAIKQKMLDFYIRQAKASVRRKIVMDANMKSFEDIRTGVEDD